MILLGSVMAMPGGCDTVLAMSSEMLSDRPTKEMTVPARPISRPGDEKPEGVSLRPSSR